MFCLPPVEIYVKWCTVILWGYLPVNQHLHPRTWNCRHHFRFLSHKGKYLKQWGWSLKNNIKQQQQLVYYASTCSYHRHLCTSHPTKLRREWIMWQSSQIWCFSLSQVRKPAKSSKTINNPVKNVIKSIIQGFFAFIYLLFSVMPPLLSEDTDPTLRAALVVNCIVQMIQIILQIAFTVDLEKKAGTRCRL